MLTRYKLTLKERYIIEEMIQANHKYKTIAIKLNLPYQVLCYEIRQNGGKYYEAKKAHHKIRRKRTPKINVYNEDAA